MEKTKVSGGDISLLLFEVFFKIRTSAIREKMEHNCVLKQAAAERRKKINKKKNKIRKYDF